MSRSTVAQRVDALVSCGLVVEDGHIASTGGRPAIRLRFNGDYGIVLVGDMGATHCRVGITDLACRVLIEEPAEIAMAEGPEAVLGWLERRFDALLAEIGRSHEDVVGVGIGLPGPVEHASGRAVSPPIMPGWDGYPVGAHLVERYGAPTLVDNDVNIMALGEYWTHWRDAVNNLLFVKVGTGIGCGIVASGHIQRGAQGAAGDIGHIQVAGHEDAVCACGNTGCVEAIASGGAMAARLRDQGRPTPHGRAVVDLVKAGDTEAIRLVRESGRALGEVLAAAVNFANPSVIVIGGDLAQAHEQLLAGVREVVYQRSLPLATRHLRIIPSRLGDRAGVRGASVMVAQRVLAPAAVDELIARSASAGA